MEKSSNFNFYLPSRDTDDIADINQISENFRVIDEKMVEKVEGKGLSTNDYTNEDKEKVKKMGDAVTDQTYDPKSKNAQSGLAVAEAIGTVPIKVIANGESLASLDSGVYIVKNKLCLSSTSVSLGKNTALFAIVSKKDDDSGAYIQVFRPDLDKVEIYDAPKDPGGNHEAYAMGYDVNYKDLANKAYVDDAVKNKQHKFATVGLEEFSLNLGFNLTHPENMNDTRYQFIFSNDGLRYESLGDDYGNRGGLLPIETCEPTGNTDAANKAYVDNSIGSIETALDSIIAIQEQLIGGAE